MLAIVRRRRGDIKTKWKFGSVGTLVIRVGAEASKTGVGLRLLTPWFECIVMI